MSAAPEVVPRIDLTEMDRYLAVIAPDGNWTFQTFDDSDQKRHELVAIIHSSESGYRDRLVQLNERGAGIFFNVSRTNSRGRTEKDIIQPRAFYTDMDAGKCGATDPFGWLEFYNESPGMLPNLVTQTSVTNLHFYLLISDMPLLADMPKGQFKSLQTRATEIYGGDPDLNMGPQGVMRLPGFLNWKGSPFLVRVHQVSDIKPYAFAWAESMFAPLKSGAGGTAKPEAKKKTSRYKQPDTVAEGNRDKSLTDFAGWRRAKPYGDDDEQLLAAMTAFNACFVPPLSESYLQKKWQYLCRKFEQWEPEASSAPIPIFRCAGDAKVEPVRWLWQERIALGKLTLIGGNPGLGKSLVSTGMAACVSTGGQWPDRTPCPQGQVLMLSAEDDLNDTILPRLIAAGADTQQVYILESVVDPNTDGHTRLVSLDTDMQAMTATLDKLDNCKLLVIDPISAYLGGCDSHNNSEVRGLLAQLAKLAAERGVAVLVITHLNKSSGLAAAYRVTGSLAFTAACRAAYAVIADPGNPARRILTPIKNNLGDDKTGFAYQIESDADNRPVLMWEPEPVTATADELLAADADSQKAQPRLSAACWLRDLLQACPVLVEEIRQAAHADRRGWRTVERAKKDELIQSERLPEFQGKIQWRLPTPAECAAHAREQDKDAPLAVGETAEGPDF